MTQNRVAAIVGAGPGLGAALSRLLSSHGWSVALLARRPAVSWTEDPAWVAAPGAVLPIACDVTQASSVDAAFTEVEAAVGPPTALIYNAALLVRGGVLDLSPEQFEECWRTAAAGAFHCAQRVMPAMLKAGAGSIVFSGATASLRGGAGFAAFASAKFALRGLAQALAREVGPRGIHVAHVVLDGLIWSERTRERFNPAREACMEPQAIAQSYWNLMSQDRSSWTHELDLRPGGEKF